MSLIAGVLDAGVRVMDPADGDDVAQVAFLEAEGRAALEGQRGGERWLVEHPEIGAAWADRCDRPGTDVLVAHIGPVVVGYLLADLGSDHILRIDQVWITPEARENGFGDSMLELAIDRARARGAVAVEGQSLPGDRHTKNLYERAGIVARLITTYKSLTPAD